MREPSQKAEWEDEYETEAEYDFSEGILNPFADSVSSFETEQERSMFRDIHSG